MRRPPGRPSARAARATQTETRDRAQPGWRPTSDLKPQSQAQSVLGPGITAALLAAAGRLGSLELEAPSVVWLKAKLERPRRRAGEPTASLRHDPVPAGVVDSESASHRRSAARAVTVTRDRQ